MLQQEKINMQRRAGVLAPLFSLYSKNSIGIGEFRDLKLFIDWANLTGNSIVQLLPMNETGPLFCPYDALSSFALEPAYISLEAVWPAQNKYIKERVKGLKKRYRHPQGYVDHGIKKEKIQLLWELFLFQEEPHLEEFKRFEEENACWLEDFALYKALKEAHQGLAWYDWQERFKNRDKMALEGFRKEYSRKITFEAWLQWQLFKQFKEAKGYAQAKKVLLKGDLPILISRDSADVWAHPEFFKLDFAAGAPPDMYCAKGQRWGMPTYDWERIADDGYKYLKEKLKFCENFYDIIRIDHVVGLFRIWSIPYDEPLENQGLNGFFEPANEAEWEAHGRKILKVMLDGSNMFLCAEDLGVIPKACTETLRKLNIPGNDVERWAKDWNVKHDFLRPEEYRKLSVTMLSTHDTTNWPAWWENEAGTVDEDLSRRKCAEVGIDFDRVNLKLFDSSRASHGRLRWKDEIDSVEKLIKGLSLFLDYARDSLRSQGTAPKERLRIFIGLYENTYAEKEKLWKQLGLRGAMREKCGKEIFRAVLKLNLQASSLFCINTIVDLLYLGDVWQGDAYQYRINTPGTIGGHNWSLKIPLSLEELIKHPITKQIRKLVADSGRI